LNGSFLKVVLAVNVKSPPVKSLASHGVHIGRLLVSDSVTVSPGAPAGAEPPLVLQPPSTLQIDRLLETFMLGTLISLWIVLMIDCVRDSVVPVGVVRWFPVEAKRPPSSTAYCTFIFAKKIHE
jgi:hypothetical protein